MTDTAPPDARHLDRMTPTTVESDEFTPLPARPGAENMAPAPSMSRGARMPAGPAAPADQHDGGRGAKRRKLTRERYERVCQGGCAGEEDVRLLNRAFRSAEDVVAMKEAQIAALRHELSQTKASYERREWELRQDLLFRHLMASVKADREHEREKVGLHRLVDFLRSDHERQMEELEQQHVTALDEERARSQQAIALAQKEKQQAVDRSHSAYLQVQNMHTIMEHSNAVARLYEGDLKELRRLDIEEAERRDAQNRGMPPSYDSLVDATSYLSPYGANRHRDRGKLELETVTTTVAANFMRQLRVANKTSLALREHEERSRAASAGSMLFHSAMLAFATACQHLKALLESTIDMQLETVKTCGQVVDETSLCKAAVPSGVGADSALDAASSDIPAATVLGSTAVQKQPVKSIEKQTINHPIDLFSQSLVSPCSHHVAKPVSAETQAVITVADRVLNTIYDLAAHAFAALDIREHTSERLCSNKCVQLGTWMRLADDTLLQCLKRRLGATAVHDVFSDRLDQALTCTQCLSEHCGGYCVRLHTLSYQITRLRVIRRTLDKISSSTRVGMYFGDSWTWLKDTLEKERELSATAVLPATHQATPVMTEEEMALAMQLSVLDPTQAAAQRAIQRDYPQEELARRLQALRDLHFPQSSPTQASVTAASDSSPSQDHAEPADQSSDGSARPSVRSAASQTSTQMQAFASRGQQQSAQPSATDPAAGDARLTDIVQGAAAPHIISQYTRSDVQLDAQRWRLFARPSNPDQR